MPLPTIGAEITVSAGVGNQTLPTVAAKADGTFAIAWLNNAYSTYHLRGFSADGTPGAGTVMQRPYAYDEWDKVVVSTSIEDRIELAGLATNELGVLFIDKGGAGGVSGDVCLWRYWTDYSGLTHSSETTLDQLDGEYGLQESAPFLFSSPEGFITIGYGLDGGDAHQITIDPTRAYATSSGDSPEAQNRAQTEGTAGEDGTNVFVYLDVPTGMVRITTKLEFSGNAVGLGSHPHVARLADGGFAVAWDGPAESVLVRLYEADGATPRGAAITVDGNDASQSHVSALSDGRVLVVWRDLIDDQLSTASVLGRFYNADGTADTDTFTIETLTSFGPATGAPRAAELADGRIVVTYQDGPISTSDIMAKILDPRLDGVSVSGTTVDDDYVGSKFADTFVTGNGDDRVTGGGAGDIIHGGLGNDTLSGDAGGDILLGHAGKDVLTGGAGVDTMSGGSGNDTYFVDSGPDVVTEQAGGGIDHILSSVDFTLGAQIENLTLTGAAKISGVGNGLNNKIIGNGGNNALAGGNGDDKLDGGAGADTLTGGAGTDSMTGGLGSDTFDFNLIGESGLTAATWDVITDFDSNGTDLIDVSTIDAIAGGANNAFTIVNGAAFTALGQLRFYQSGGSTYVELNTTGTNAADAIYRLTNEVNLDAADFLA